MVASGRGGARALGAAATISVASWIMMGSGIVCGQLADRTRRPDLLSREFGCCNVVTVARAFELGAKWEATPPAERGVGQFIHRLRRDAA